MKLLIYVAGSMLVAACSSRSPGPRDPEVVRYQISETESLRIRGIAADGSTVGELTVKYGPYYSEEFERDADGTMIDFDIHGLQASHRSDGRSALELPPIGGPEVKAFLTDARLVDVLARWQITMASDDIAGEGSYDACPTSGLFAPSSNCGASSCRMVSSPMYPYMNEQSQGVCCANQGQGAVRKCTSANAETSCGLAGSLGCKVCWTASYDYNCEALEGGTSAWPQMDFLRGSFQTDVGADGDFDGAGTSIPLRTWVDGVTFVFDTPLGGYSIEEIPADPEYPTAWCSGDNCYVGTGPTAVVITHDESQISYTFTFDYYN